MPKDSASVTLQPYSLDAIGTTADWQERFVWPLHYPDAVDLADKVAWWGIDTLIPECGDERFDVAVLVSPYLISVIHKLAHKALMAQGAIDREISFDAEHDQLGLPKIEETRRHISSILSCQVESFGAVEAVARTAARQYTLSGIGEVFRGLVGAKPKIVATSHNALLQQQALTLDAGVRFMRASDMVRPLAPALDSASAIIAGVSDDHRKMAGSLRPIAEKFFPTYAEQVIDGVEVAIAQAFETGQAQLDVVGKMKLPDCEIWSTTVGRYAGRLIDIEAMKRGQPVLRFSHGGAYGMIEDETTLGLAEVSPASGFVMATEKLTVDVGSQLTARAPKLLRNRQPEDVFRIGKGDPVFDRVPFFKSQRTSRPTVTFVMTGFFETLVHRPPALSAPVALDWRLRLTRKLSELPIDVVIRPHPEDPAGFAKTAQSFGATVSKGNFADALAASDILVFDWPYSTAFWETLCSGRPTVLINMAETAFLPEKLSIVQENCRMISPVFDARGRVSIDWDSLAEAISSAPWTDHPSRCRSIFSNNSPTESGAV